MWQSLLAEFVGNAALQTAVIAAVVWCVVRLTKKSGLLPEDGADAQKRLTAIVAAVLVGGAQAWLLWLTQHAPPDWGALVASIILAALGATGLHTLTKPKPA